jgi:hypothetical protein
MKKKESIDIAASSEKVWSLLVKLENVFAIDRLVKRFDFVGEQHSGVGKMFYMVKKKLMVKLLGLSVNLQNGRKIRNSPSVKFWAIVSRRWK